MSFILASFMRFFQTILPSSPNSRSLCFYASHWIPDTIFSYTHFFLPSVLSSFYPSIHLLIFFFNSARHLLPIFSGFPQKIVRCLQMNIIITITTTVNLRLLIRLAFLISLQPKTTNPSKASQDIHGHDSLETSDKNSAAYLLHRICHKPREKLNEFLSKNKHESNKTVGIARRCVSAAVSLFVCQGQEFTPNYLLEYQRDNSSKWMRFRDKNEIEVGWNIFRPATFDCG